MGDLIDILVKLGSMEPGGFVKAALRFIRAVMLLVFSVFLYKSWVSDFALVSSPTELLDYFMSDRFLYSVLIYLFVLLCETFTIVLVTKLHAMLFVRSALRLTEQMKMEAPKLSEVERSELKQKFDDWVKLGATKITTWLGDEYEHEKEIKHLVPKKNKIRPERMDGLSLFAVEIFVYMLCTGHSGWWALLLVFFILVFAGLKALLLIVKTALPVVSDVHVSDTARTNSNPKISAETIKSVG